MRNLGLMALVACLNLTVWSRGYELGIRAWDAALPPQEIKAEVFSPFAFEMDCVVLAEASDTIARAGIAETIGVLREFPEVYGPILSCFADQSGTNQFRCLTTRAFCLADPRAATPDFRERLMSVYESVIARKYPPLGAEAWLKAKLDGEAEAFSLSLEDARGEGEVFRDLVSVTARPQEAFWLLGTSRMTGVTEVERYTAEKYVTYRLALKGGAFLYLIEPQAEATLSDVRHALRPAKIENVILEPTLEGDSRLTRIKARLTLPVLDMISSISILEAFRVTKIPTGEFKYLGSRLGIRNMVQFCRFRLEPSVQKPEGIVTANESFVFSRPFIFFVHHPATASMPVVGCYQPSTAVKEVPKAP